MIGVILDVPHFPQFFSGASSHAKQNDICFATQQFSVIAPWYASGFTIDSIFFGPLILLLKGEEEATTRGVLLLGSTWKSSTCWRVTAAIYHTLIKGLAGCTFPERGSMATPDTESAQRTVCTNSPKSRYITTASWTANTWHAVVNTGFGLHVPWTLNSRSRQRIPSVRIHWVVQAALLASRCASLMPVTVLPRSYVSCQVRLRRRIGDTAYRMWIDNLLFWCDLIWSIKEMRLL